jgi:citronellol/citronellal dehydrogenase
MERQGVVRPIAEEFALTDQVAIITGGSVGIGAEITRVFARAGAHCVVATNRPETLPAIESELHAAGHRCLTMHTDVRKDEDIRTLVERTVAQFGRIDIVVNNAGGSYLFPLRETPIEKWDNILELNLRGPYLLMREAGERMIDQGAGVFVGISSMAGITGVRGGASYSVSKCGLQMLTRVVAAEWGRYGIRANCIAPGPTASEGALRSWARGGMSTEQLGQRTPLKRVGTPRDIALATLFLASDASSWISGETLGVNGGPVMSGLPDV